MTRRTFLAMAATVPIAAKAEITAKAPTAGPQHLVGIDPAIPWSDRTDALLFAFNPDLDTAWAFAEFTRKPDRSDWGSTRT